MIRQFSTGGRGPDQAARGTALELRPDMASLSTGSVNFPTIVYESAASLILDLATKMHVNPIRPEIQLFDLSHIHGARRLVDAGLMDKRLHVQIVMGIKNALPAEEQLLHIVLDDISCQLPRATWTAAGIDANQARVLEWGLARGGDGVRTGPEDNIRFGRDRLATGNAELVTFAAQAIGCHCGRPATVAEARATLGLAA